MRLESNRSALSSKQHRRLQELLNPRRVGLRTARAYRLKHAFQESWELPPALAEPYLKRWYFWATHSRLPAMIRVARTIRRHGDGVLRWFPSRVSNGMLEAMNSLIQAAKARTRGRGHRTPENFRCSSPFCGVEMDEGVVGIAARS